MTTTMYGSAISDALRRKTTTLEQLITLRDHAIAILKAQGDLRGALVRLNKEIKQRQIKARKTKVRRKKK